MSLRVSIFGLGYVGCVSAACLARDGHTVIGVDTQPSKIAALNAGTSPIVEPGLAELLSDAVKLERLTATADVAEAVAASDVAIICVGTPSDHYGHADSSAVRRVCQAIGDALRSNGRTSYTVLLRSTVPPGTTQELVVPTLREAAGTAEVHVGFHPEFLREASAIADYDAPARIIIGCDAEEAHEIVQRLYPAAGALVVRTSFEIAELLKYADNSFHATKIAFANEIGAIAKAYGIDGVELMSVFVQDTKLNISPAYLRPGGAFGGSCLPKDLRALINHARRAGVSAPLLAAVVQSNEDHKRRVLEIVKRHGKRRIAILGLAFKAGTDDLRESPAVELTETLVGKGYDVVVFDPSVNMAALVGSNKSYIEQELPHVQRLLCETLSAAVKASDILVITSHHQAFVGLPELMTTDHIVVDLARFFARDQRPAGKAYEGICW